MTIALVCHVSNIWLTMNTTCVGYWTWDVYAIQVFVLVDYTPISPRCSVVLRTWNNFVTKTALPHLLRSELDIRAGNTS